MDGVLCNYEAKLYSLYTRAEIEHNRRDWWNDSVYNHKIFEHLEYMPGAEELLRFVMRQGIKVEILTSTGHGEAKNEVRKQKAFWLREHGLDHLKVNYVEHAKEKSEYAKPDRILIDDRNKCIEPFREAGGIGIHYKDVKQGIKQLKEILHDTHSGTV